MSQPEPPKITFPCEYPIKVIGDAAPDYQSVILETLQPFAPGVGASDCTQRPSSGGRFMALTITITATGEQQLADLFAALKATGRVRMVL